LKSDYFKSPVFDEVMILHHMELSYIVTLKCEMSVYLADFMDNKAKIKKFEKHAKVDGISVILIKTKCLRWLTKPISCISHKAPQPILLKCPKLNRIRDLVPRFRTLRAQFKVVLKV
jgi:vacuolar-type H+-ATPase subunit F/Vma7